MAKPIRIKRPRKHVWFETKTPDGNIIRIKGDPNMDEETRLALGKLMDLVAKKYADEQASKDKPEEPQP